MAEDTRICILVVDDHEMVRRGLAVFIRTFDDFVLVGEARNGVEAIALTEQLKPDIILMDLMMPEMDGITAIRAIHKQFPQIHIIALTSANDDNMVKTALQAGAISYLQKNVSSDQLALAIRAANQGNATLSPEATRALIKSSPSPSAQQYQFSERELEVLTLLVQGLNNPEIAEKLYISRATVKYHVSNLYSKLGINNRSELIVIAVQQKLV